MVYLVWTLLNTGLILFFIVICFKATKLIREKAGLFASVVFVFGLLSFTGQSDNDKPNSQDFQKWQFASEDSLSGGATFHVNVDLEETLVSTYQLGIQYGKDRQGQGNVPVSAYSFLTGFISGTKWNPEAISVDRTSNNRGLKYLVSGVVEWSLLGVKIFSQTKSYEGVVPVK